MVLLLTSWSNSSLSWCRLPCLLFTFCRFRLPPCQSSSTPPHNKKHPRQKWWWPQSRPRRHCHHRMKSKRTPLLINFISIKSDTKCWTLPFRAWSAWRKSIFWPLKTWSRHPAASVQTTLIRIIFTLKTMVKKPKRTWTQLIPWWKGWWFRLCQSQSESTLMIRKDTQWQHSLSSWKSWSPCFCFLPFGLGDLLRWLWN